VEGGLGEGEIEFLRTSYREYYYRHSSSLWIPPRLESREIGFLTFEGHFKRHMRAGTPGELVGAVLREVPWGIFYSVSYYEDPGSPEEVTYDPGHHGRRYYEDQVVGERPGYDLVDRGREERYGGAEVAVKKVLPEVDVLKPEGLVGPEESLNVAHHLLVLLR